MTRFRLQSSTAHFHLIAIILLVRPTVRQDRRVMFNVKYRRESNLRNVVRQPRLSDSDNTRLPDKSETMQPTLTGTVPSVSLPTELVYEILLIAATSDRSTLSACVFLSKSINHLLQPILYRSVTITSSESLQYFASLACELKSDSPLRHVRNLWLGLRPGLLVQFLDLTLHQTERAGTWWRSELIRRVLRGCNLKRLDLDAELRARPRLDLSCAGESLDEFHFHFPASGQTLVDLDSLPRHTKKLHLLVSGDPTLPLDLEIMSLNITHLDVMMTVTYTVSRILPIVRRLPQLSVLLLRLSRLDNVAIIKRGLDELIQYGQTTLTVAVAVWTDSNGTYQEWNKIIWDEAGYGGQEAQDGLLWELAEMPRDTEWVGRVGDNKVRMWRML